MRTRIVELMAKKQAETRRIIDQAALIEATGLSRPTVRAWIDGSIDRFDSKTIVAFCNYFNCDVGDILTIVDEPELPDDAPKPL